MNECLSAVAASVIDAGGRTIAAMNIAFNSGAVKRQELLGSILPELRQAVARFNSILTLNAG
jgi:DNA-binding IclR family transcriptional regulator